MAPWLWRPIFKFRQCIFAISLFTPLGKSCWPSFEQTWITFVQSLVKTGSVVLEKKILKLCQCLFAILILHPPWKRMWPFICINLNPLYQRILLWSLIEIGLVVLKKNMKMWRVYDNDDINKDNHGQQTNFDQNSSLEPSAQVS